MYILLNRIWIVTPGRAMGVPLKGVGRGQKLSFSEHSHVAYQIKGDDE